MARISYRVETQRGGQWRSEGVFDDLAMARAQADQFAGASGIDNVRIVAESGQGGKRDLVYDAAQGVDRTKGDPAPAQAAPESRETAETSPQETAPNLSSGQILKGVAVLSVAALGVALLLMVLLDPLG